MIVETSALVAMVRNEPEADEFTSSVARDGSPSMSAANYLEAAIVIDARRIAAVSERLDQILQELRVRIEPVTEAQVRVARAAYRAYGKGSGSRAQLNFGDCFAYALAKVAGEPLLFKGDDFVHTDVTRAPTN